MNAYAEAMAGSIYIARAAGAPMQGVQKATLLPERGIDGDRYFFGVGSFSRWPGPGRAVTLIEQEAVDAIHREHGIDLHEGRSRRNVVTVGIRLAELIGKTFRVGGAVLRGVRLAEPCRYLERRTAPGIMEAMKGRGGLRADVLRGGVVRVGDPVDVRAPDTPVDAAAGTMG
jgi:MOSC domain-containing protein YiiM